MSTLQALWDDYQQNVLPPTAGDIQRTETKRAFYAGAHSMMKLSMNASAEHLSEEAGAAILDGVADELVQFSSDVRSGKA